jgi:hypothetical protein
MTGISSPSHVEAIVAGTLCLMSVFANAPSRSQAERIADNLDNLAAERGITPELRTLCRRLAQRWDAIASGLRAGEAPEAARVRIH